MGLVGVCFLSMLRTVWCWRSCEDEEDTKMNDNSLKLPKFKYHPNVYDKEKVLDAVQFDNNVCQCCGNKTDVYVSTMYCSEEVDCICMECVANGKAAEKYDGEFIQYAEEISDEEKRTELFRRIPGYCS